MSFAVLAEFPLGTYRAHRGGGVLDEVISPARLHAALLNAAGAGPRAIEHDAGLSPCPADAAVLEWLEQHPPDGLVLPPRAVTDERMQHFRDDGTLFRSQGRYTVKKPGKRLPGAVTFSGPVGWCWNEPPEEAVREALEALCRDVAYLGMAESPVRLHVGEPTPTHERADVTAFAGIGIPMPAATPGRTQELEKAHAAMLTATPSARQDAIGSDEKTVRAPAPSSRLRTVYYRRSTPESAETPGWPVPWETVVCVPLSQEVPEEQRVTAAVSVHRGLIKRLDRLGLDVPPCVTGVYPQGQKRPANGAAIHFLPAQPSAWHRGPDGVPVLAVMIPAGMPEAADAVEHAIQGLRPILSSRNGSPVRVAGTPVRVPADDFWVPPAQGAVRWWETEPAAVPDLRPLRQNWSGADTVAASTALLWRDVLAVPGRGDARSRALADRVQELGVHVRDVRLVPGDASRFVHKTPKGTVVRPYRAVLHLGELAGDGTALALGQSRHLGCGLLVPRDEHPAAEQPCPYLENTSSS